MHGSSICYTTTDACGTTRIIFGITCNFKLSCINTITRHNAEG